MAVMTALVCRGLPMVTTATQCSKLGALSTTYPQARVILDGDFARLCLPVRSSRRHICGVQASLSWTSSQETCTGPLRTCAEHSLACPICLCSAARLLRHEIPLTLIPSCSAGFVWTTKQGIGQATCEPNRSMRPCTHNAACSCYCHSCMESP